MGGGVEAELSAGHLLFVDGADYVTAKNLVMRLFFGVPDIATRLMRLGCLPGCPDAVAEAAVGGPNARTPLQRAADQQAYKKLVAIARYAELWGFDKPNLCAVVKQALHLSETKQFATVASIAITAASAWTMHTASATNSGVKSTSVAYAKSVKLFCQFASNPESQQPGGVVLPVNRYVVVTFLRSEQARPKRTGNQSGIVGDDESDTGSDGERNGGGDANDADDDDNWTGEMQRGLGEGGGGGGRVRGASGSAQRGDNSLAGSSQAGKDAHASNRGADGANPMPRGGLPGSQLSAADAPTNLHPPSVGHSPPAAASTFAPPPPRLFTGGTRTPPPPAAGRNASGVTAPRVRTVGQTVVKMHQSAMAKVGLIFNQLWTACGCVDCARYDVEAYALVGTYNAANLVVSETQRNRTLENTVSGAAKATGLRDPTLPDKERRVLIETLLLSPTTSKRMHKSLLLAALFVLSFSLEARGATTRGLEWSDHAVRQFTAMFGTAGVDVLCTYVSATKTGEGGAYCLGSIAHIDPWLCPLGAVADALVADCRREGQDLLTPPVSFAPNFNPTDAEMRATGIDPKYFWASASELGWRPWYQWRQIQAMRGGPYKAMSYDFHRDNLRKAAGGADINVRAVSTHAFRRVAAQKGKESGVPVADNLSHGMWNLGAANGAYDGLILNAPMMTALSGRSADCSSPVTPRLSVEVPASLQCTICPWLDSEEAEYAARVRRDHRCQDQALLDFFALVRVARSVFFQTWAARVVITSLPPNAEILRHPLLNNDHFRDFCKTMAKVLADDGRTVEAAVSQVMPQLSHAVKVAVEAVAAASSSCVVDVERRLSIQMDDAVADIKAHNNQGFSAMMELLGSTAAEVRSLRADVAHLRGLAGGALGGGVSAEEVLGGPGGVAGGASNGAAGHRRGAGGTGGSGWGGGCSATAVPAREPLPRGASVRDTVAAAAAAVVDVTQYTTTAVVQLPPTVTPIAEAPSPPVISSRLAQDRENVRQLTLQHKLEGVPIFSGSGQYVPLVPLTKDLGWEAALSEYAEGFIGRGVGNRRASIREVEAMFGERWRLCIPDPADRRRVGKLYSARSPIYRAFQEEYAKRGAALGVGQVVSFVKAKYKGRGGAVAVYKLAQVDYPAKK